jgi:hypothetical protein
VSNENRETLQPGDLCVIIRPNPAQPVEVGDHVLKYLGRTVVLIEHHRLANELCAMTPYWRCSGLPPECAVSHVVLRKIPPDRMLDARMHDTPVVETHPAGEDVLV